MDRRPCTFDARGLEPNLCRDIYERFGFVIVRGVCDQEQIYRLREDIRRIISFEGDEHEDMHEVIYRLDRDDKDKLYIICQTIAKFASGGFCSLIIKEFCQPIFAPDNCCAVVLTQGVLVALPADDRLAYDWHQESNYLVGVGVPFINAWMPVFEPSTRENGAMSVLAGSHRLGKLKYRKQIRSENSFTNLIADDERFLKEDYDEIYCCIDPGDVVIFDENLVHRSNFNQTERTRLTFVTRIAFAQAVPGRLSFSKELY